jgi:hypothetical protein
MKDTEIIEALNSKLTVPGGVTLWRARTYQALKEFSAKLQEAKTTDGRRFRKPLSVIGAY